MSSPNTLHLKVMINKQKTKVVFAEANNDFVDVLLSFLTLPLGKLASILSNPAIGSLNSLRNGLYRLDSSHFCVGGGAKQMLLNPKSSFEAECRRLKLDISLSQRTVYFVCQESNCPKTSYNDISLYSDIATCSCGKPLNRETYVGSVAGNSDGEVFTINPSSFLITDDLRVAPIDTGFLQTLNNLGITDTAGSELQSVSFGMLDIMNLLKLSLFSTTPLTDLVMKNTEMSSASATVNPEPGYLLHRVQKSDANPRKMVLKVCMQKSTNEFVFAEATAVFVEFLFSLLTVPLGGVGFLLGGNTCLKNIDNLYRSIIDNMDKKYFTTTEMKDRLINPKLAHGYVNGFKNIQFLPLIEESLPRLYYEFHREGWNSLTYKFEKTYYKYHVNKGQSMVSSFKSIQQNYVKKQTICFVSDDLTVTPSLASSLSILNTKGIPLSDLKEMEFQIGLEEALSILKASLTSKTPLTDVLIKPMLNKLPKLEHQPKQER